jgi:hypothetical protein
MNLQWINSAGGPLLCASHAVGKAWRGMRGSSVGEVRSDYERACDQMDYVGAVACGSSQVLVLGDEPLQSTFIVKDGCVLVVRWVACESSERAVSAIAQLPSILPTIEDPKSFRLDDFGLIMFDSALDGGNSSTHASVDLQPGVYAVTTELYKSERVYEFLVHRFLRSN